MGRAVLVVVPLLLALVPPGYLVVTVAKHAVNVPHKDQWVFAYDVVAMHDGTLTLARLWQQHNEHRIPVARSVLLLLARVSGWDIRWEIALSVAIAIAALLVVSWMIVRTIWHVAPLSVGVLVLWSATLLCSLVQWQNWTWGWQVGLFLTVAAGPASAALLVRMATTEGATARWAAGAAMVAILAAFSNGAGLVLVALLPIAVAGFRWIGVRVGGWVLAMSVVVAVAVIASYVTDWRPAISQPPMQVRGHVAALTTYVITFLGNPIAPSRPGSAWWWGVLALTVFVGGGLAAWVLAPSHRRALLPWLALGGYSLGIAGLVSVGRFGAGAHTALLSRYSTYSVPLWLALGPIMVIALGGISRRTLRMGLTAIAGLVLCVTTTHLVRGDWHGARRMAARASVFRTAASCLRNPDRASDHCYGLVCWNAAFARRAALRLDELGLSLWAPSVLVMEQRQPDGQRRQRTE